MLLEFEIENFGVIGRKVSLSMEATNDDTLEKYYVRTMKDGTRINRVAMIYGVNAAGKSTLLNAYEWCLRLMAAQPLDKTKVFHFQPHLLDRDCIAKPTSMKMVFYADEIKHEYEIELDRTKIIHETMNFYPNGRKALLYKRGLLEDGTVRIGFGATISISAAKLEVLEGYTVSNVGVLGAYTRTNVSIPELDRLFTFLIHKNPNVVAPNAYLTQWAMKSLADGIVDKDLVRKFLKFADFNISDFDVEDNTIDFSRVEENIIHGLPLEKEEKEHLRQQTAVRNIDVHFRHYGTADQEYASINYDYESAGTKRAFGFAAILPMVLKKNMTLRVDELESSLHHELQKFLLKTFLVNDSQAQLIFTTHNVALLRERDILRNDAVWFADKSEKGDMLLYSAADFKAKDLRTDRDIFKPYMIGKLGATPSTETIFEWLEEAEG